MAAVNEESNRKYANLVESIPARLEQFDEPKPPKPIEDINEEPWNSNR